MRLLLTDLGASLSLLSRLPIPVAHEKAAQRSAQAAWAWPIAGAVLAFLAALPGVALSAVGVPALIAAGVSLGALIMVTGALHEDGLADTVDGLWGGWAPTQRLEIMKDSRVGVYGVLALVVGVGLRWTALAALLAAGPLPFLAGMIVSAAVSRATMAGVMQALPHAREDGLSRTVGRVPVPAARGAAALGVLLSLVAGPAAALVALVFGTAAAIAVARVAIAKIGGQTGDILGAVQQASEIASLIALAAVLA